MEPTLTIEPEGTASVGGRTIAINATLSGTWGSLPRIVSRHIPPAVSREQAYYWTIAWQRGEKAALEDLGAGRSRTFDDPDAAVRWLFSEE